jgi:hypothetical protein
MSGRCRDRDEPGLPCAQGVSITDFRVRRSAVIVPRESVMTGGAGGLVPVTVRFCSHLTAATEALTVAHLTIRQSVSGGPWSTEPRAE